MSTTIDSLQIEIQSNSNNAAGSIDDLAKALKKLNKNGDVSNAVNNLNDLRKSLHAFVNMPSSASKIESLAKSLTSLKKVGSINLGASLGGVKTAMESLKTINVDGVAPQIERIAQALTPLNNVKGSGFNAMMNGFKKLNEVVDVMDSATIDRFVAKIKELDEKLGPVSQKLVAIGNAFNGVNSKALTASGGMSVFDGKVNTTTLNLQSMISVVQNLWSSLQPIINLLKNTIGQALEWDGIEYQFGNTFGEQADEYYDKIVQITDALKINKQMFMENSAMAASMLIGFGVNRADAREMGVGYTELAYDIWAAFNNVYKSFDGADGAMAAVRSAISGEVEPIRRAGFTIVDSQLKITAANHGIAYSSEKATEAQKSYLRYLTLVDQAASKGVIGTYASEMDTAEGVIRTFRQQLTSLAQTFGSIFLPILVEIMPYLQAFVELLGDVIRAVAAFFNIDIQKVDFSDSGLKNMASDADSANKEIEKAEQSLKDLKNATIGIDELNVISPTSGNGSGGNGTNSGAGYDGLDIGSIWDKSIFDNIQNQVDGIKEKLKPILALVVTIGATILAWKVSESFIAGLDTVKLMLKAIAGQKGASSALTLLVSPKAADRVAKLANILKKTPIGAAILGSGSTSIGAALAAVAAVAAAVLSVVGGLVLVYQKSENFRNGLIAIGDGLLWVFDKVGEGVSWVGEKIGELGQWIREKTSEFIPSGVLDFLGAFELGIGDLLITAGGLALFGPWGLLIEGAVLAIKAVGYAASDSLEPVDLFGEGISDVTKEKVAPFVEKMNELDNTIKTLDWSNAIVTESDVANIQAKLETITDTIINELDSDKNQALAKIDPLREAMSEEKFADLQAKIEKSYAFQEQIVLLGENRINEILAKASEEGRALTAEEAEEINEIREGMMRTGIKYLSESETESNLILQRLKDNASKLSAEQASQVIKNAWSAKNETIKAAEEQYKGILMEAQRMLDTGTISKDEYDEIVKAAEDTRDKAVSAAETQYKNIVETAKTKMGEYAKYIDEETGEIKSKWKVFCEDTSKKWKQTWTDIKEWWNKTIAPFFTKEFWADKFDGIKKGLSEKLDEAWAKIKNFFSESEWKKKVDEAMKAIKDNFKMPSLPKIKLEVSYDTNVGAVKTAIYEALGLDGWPRLSWSAYAQGGFPAMGQVFIAREAGPEMVGTIGSRSAVANNDQIVEAVSAGVYSAVVAAMSAASGGGTQAVNVYLDGKQITASVEKRQKERGAMLMTGGMAYGY